MPNSHKPQFLKPLLPDFHSGVTIPLGFFTAHRREDKPENMETKIGRYRSNLGSDTRRQETHRRLERFHHST
uniref:Uncharacterized protein n=1 Tax=Brassica campestris TaxID=3711 RepID=A0A3P5Z7U5_BRACM|nr:unnamed protein product [Brassica rapa]